MRRVQTIDISGFRRGDEQSRSSVPRKVAECCEDVGFLVVSGHGVPSSLIAAVRETAMSFFQCDIDEKMRAATPADPGDRVGYFPSGTGALARTLDEVTPPDLMERFVVGPDAVKNARVRPDNPAWFEPMIKAYVAAMEALSDDMMRIIALALNLPERFFVDAMSQRMNRLNLTHYQTPPEGVLAGQFGAGAHSDFGALTILHKEQGAHGLQVQNEDMTWEDIEPQSDTFIVNIGDIMERWSNRRWVSTMHRVLRPDSNASDDSKNLSIVYFIQPNQDFIIEPIVAEGTEPLFEPIVAGEYFLEKRNKTVKV